jgi:hypothetical protein
MSWKWVNEPCEHIAAAKKALEALGVEISLGSGAQVSNGDDCSNLLSFDCQKCHVSWETS